MDNKSIEVWNQIKAEHGNDSAENIDHEITEGPEGYSNDNVINRLPPEEREAKLKTQPVYSEEEEMGPTENLSNILQNYFEDKKVGNLEYSLDDLRNEVSVIIDNLYEYQDVEDDHDEYLETWKQDKNF